MKNAIAHQKPISIKLNVDHSGGEHTLLLTRVQIPNIERSRLIGKRKVTIHLNKIQVKANIQTQGGFGTGLVPGTVKQAVGGDGLYLHKLGYCVKIDPVRGNVLYLTPLKRLSGVAGDGLYLKRGSTIQDGSGLILGAGSPFKNIPILHLLL